MGKVPISQQRKINLLHKNVSAALSRLNNHGRRHVKLIVTGKAANFTRKEITMKVNRNNPLKNSNFKRCNNG